MATVPRCSHTQLIYNTQTLSIDYAHHASDISTLTHFLLFSLVLSSLSLFSWAAVLIQKDRVHVSQCLCSATLHIEK